MSSSAPAVTTSTLKGGTLTSVARVNKTRIEEAFLDLDCAVQGTVRFGDDSLVPIEGRGIVEFTGKTGEAIKLTSVLYIPRLKNIISLDQLDERGCKVEIKKGLLHVWDRRCCLLIKIH
jgi:hypothetical protein